MRHTGVIIGAFILAAGLLFAAGATARRSTAPPLQSSPAQPEPGNRGMMRGGMMGQGMMNQGKMGQGAPEARAEMDRLVHELLSNQAAMERTKSRAALRPLLEKNRRLLERLREQMGRSWGSRGQRMNNRMGGPAARSTGRAAAVTPGSSTLAEKGRRIFATQGCSSCHGEGGVGTPAAPSLVGIGKRMSAASIAGLIRHPRTKAMPGYPLPSSQMKALIAYLEILK
jgi:mono/diheme cytochrome c family protein